MRALPIEYHVLRNRMLGYTWEAQAEHGIITIDEEELFSRVEFELLPINDHPYKVAYARDLGWRYNVDNSKWYRLRGY